MPGAARPVRARGGAAGRAVGGRWREAAGSRGRLARRGAGRALPAGAGSRGGEQDPRVPRASHHHSAQASTRRSSCGNRSTSKMQRKLGDSIHFSNMFQALLNSQWYFRLFTSRSLTSQAANDLFIVGNVPRTKGSIQDVMETISRIGVCSAQIEVFRVSWRPKTLAENLHRFSMKCSGRLTAVVTLTKCSLQKLGRGFLTEISVKQSGITELDCPISNDT